MSREDISERIAELLKEFNEKHPEYHYKEGQILLGRLHALFLACKPYDYWREVANRGFYKEVWEIKNRGEK